MQIALLILDIDSNDLKNFIISEQFSIEPKFDYKGAKIERIADLMLYDESFEKIINLNEVKNKDNDFEECISLNADQLRAFCICHYKNIGRGIATTGEKWVFTQYIKSREAFSITKVYEFLKKQFVKAME